MIINYLMKNKMNCTMITNKKIIKINLILFLNKIKIVFLQIKIMKKLIK